MSTIELPTYVPAIPLPAPVTSGSGTQSYTDPYGDVWVAANGVYGGAWRRARDVLSGRVGRTAAFTYPTSVTALSWTTPAQRDPYGMYTNSAPGPGFVVPIAGLYSFHCQLCVTFTASGQFIGLYVGPNLRTNVYNAIAGSTNQYVQAHDIAPLNAGDVLGASPYTSVALAMAGLTTSDCFFDIKYEGTG